MKFVARSISDPNGKNGGLDFNTKEAAAKHAATMNKLIEDYPTGIWNLEFWRARPEEWVVYEK
jgi:hypothetical protein